jgi:hypothetical protein
MASEKSDSGAAKQVPSQATTTAAKAHMECTAGPEKGQTLRVAPNITVLGRDALCDVVLAETVISRQHARIERRGDQWILKNLSGNGTLLNRKPVTDEAVLADHDEIRLGAKTRLKFVVETVTLSPTGRPQFRRRMSAQEEAAAKADAETAPAEEAKPSLFKRRKSLFIGLAAYFAAMLVLVTGLTVYRGCGNTGVGQRGIPVLALDDMICFADSSPPIKFLGKNTEGIVGVDSLEKPVTIPNADVQAGRAWVVPGIRNALEVQSSHQYDPEQAKACIQQAIEFYRNKDDKTKRGNLFSAVRLFQQALAYNGGKVHFDDTAHDELYRKALENLITEVNDAYGRAIILDRKGDYKTAFAGYIDVQALVPEHTNVIYDNVARRVTLLKGNHPDIK